MTEQIKNEIIKENCGTVAAVNLIELQEKDRKFFVLALRKGELWRSQERLEAPWAFQIRGLVEMLVESVPDSKQIEFKSTLIELIQEHLEEIKEQ